MSRKRQWLSFALSPTFNNAVAHTQAAVLSGCMVGQDVCHVDGRVIGLHAIVAAAGDAKAQALGALFKFNQYNLVGEAWRGAG